MWTVIPAFACPNASLGLKWLPPFCLQTRFGRRLNMDLQGKPLVVQVSFLINIRLSPWEHLALNASLPEMVLVHFCFSKGHCFFIWGQNTGMKMKVRAVDALLVCKCTHHVTTLNQSYKNWPLQPSRYSSQHGCITFMLQLKCTDDIYWYKYYLPGWSIGKYYTIPFLCK